MCNGSALGLGPSSPSSSLGAPTIFRQGFRMAMAHKCMFYVYILYSLKSKNFYYGYTEYLRERLRMHQQGNVPSTKSYLPWKLVWYSAFEIKKMAKDFEKYLKSGSGKAFAYKRLLNTEALKKDRVGQGI